jgi:hypothetical protein
MNGNDFQTGHFTLAAGSYETLNIIFICISGQCEQCVKRGDLQGTL